MELKMRSLLTLIALLVFSFSCNKSLQDVTTQQAKPKLSLENPNQVLSSFNAQHPLEHERGEYVRGEVKISMEKGENLTFSLLHTRTGVNLQYKLQEPEDATLTKALIGKVIKNAEVLFIRRSMLINDLDSDFRLEAFIDDESHPLFAQYTPELQLRGVGLGRATTAID